MVVSAESKSVSARRGGIAPGATTPKASSLIEYRGFILGRRTDVNERPSFESAYGFSREEVESYLRHVLRERADLEAAISHASAREQRASRLVDLLSNLEGKLWARVANVESRAREVPVSSFSPEVSTWEVRNSAEALDPPQTSGDLTSLGDPRMPVNGAMAGSHTGGVPEPWLVSAAAARGGGPPRPVPTEFLPYTEVETFIGHKERELELLRVELDTRLQEATVAEQLLNSHPGSEIFDAEFEAAMLLLAGESKSAPPLGPSAHGGQLGPSGEMVEPGREPDHLDASAAEDPPGQSPPRAEGRWAVTTTSEASTEPLPLSPLPVEVELQEDFGPTAVSPESRQQPGPLPPEPSLEPAPQPRSAPRTTVVTRSRSTPVKVEFPAIVQDADNSARSSSEAPIEPKSFDGNQRRSPSGRHLRQSPPDEKTMSSRTSGSLRRLPPHLLIQMGVAVVIIALILLKLG